MGFNDFMRCQCEYKTGLVAFLDILGFKEYMSNADPSDVYSFYMLMSLQYEYMMDNKINNIDMAVFSDSIIITTEDVNNTNFLHACYSIINQIYLNYGLLIRGGISHGLYYCENNISFGQAIVDAYLCEEDAKDIKIAIDHKAIPFIKKQCLWGLDYINGKYSINYYIYKYKHLLDMDENVLKKIGINLEMVFQNDRENVINLLRKYKNTKVYSKYIWLSVMFNRFCKYIKEYGIGIEWINLDEI